MSRIVIEVYVVSGVDTKMRLSDMPAGTFKTTTSRKGFKNAIKNDLVSLNNTRAYTGDYVKNGDSITIFQDQKLLLKKPSIDIELDIIYQDDYLAIVNKPAGIVVSGNKKYTLENALPKTLKKSTQHDALLRPQPIHRLDYPTSGCLLIGKTSKTVIALNSLFSEKTIHKTYVAITIGIMDCKGVIEKPIDGKISVTEYFVLATLTSDKYEALNLVKLFPKTGRKHQIRKHLASLNTPILGDHDYGKDGLIGAGNGLYLHASSLQFKHPITNEEVFASIPLPKKFVKLFSKFKDLI